MLSRRSFLKGAAAAAAVVASSGILAQKALGRVYGTVRTPGYIIAMDGITERATITALVYGQQSSFKYYADRVVYQFPQGEIRRVWLDGKEVCFTQTDDRVTFYHLLLEQFGNRVPEATAEIVA